MPVPYLHPSGLAGVFDRTQSFSNWTGMLFREGVMGQATELMELQSILGNRSRRVGDLIARDGDRVEGADVLVDQDTGVVTLTSGKIYVNGDVRSISAATLSAVPMTGDVTVGVRLVSTIITEVEEPALLGLLPGSEAEGEPGAGREVQSVAWGRSGDGGTGALYPVYLLRNGVVIDQTPPPDLSGVNAAIASYDRGAHGSYVVTGCMVSALGLISGAQHFSIGEGEANINGFKRTRQVAIRHVEVEAPDLATITAEPHTFTDSGTGTAVITFNHPPKAVLTSAVITKEKTVSIVKGTTGSADSLPDTSVTSIISAVVGGTTYTQTTDYVLSNDKIDWSPAGAEPTSGTSVSVTYRYLASVTPTSQTDTNVTLTGGVTGTAVFLSYTYKMPRIDLLCLNESGASVYIKGVSSAVRAQAPAAPSTLLSLAEIANDWINKPVVRNTDIRSIPFKELWHYMGRLFDALDLIALGRLKQDIDSREPVAKKGIFVDPWKDENYRDDGYSGQTAAIGNGLMRLAIDPSFFRPSFSAPICLSFTEEVVARQELSTSCRLVNPYQNFDPMPAEMSLSPAQDYWQIHETVNGEPEIRLWFGNITTQGRGTLSGFGGAKEDLGLTDAEIAALHALPFAAVPPGGSDSAYWHEAGVVERLSSTTITSGGVQSLDFLRQISITFTIKGLTLGETVSELKFDGVNVLPASPVVANSSGVATGAFTIPAGVTAGTKLLAGKTNLGRNAEALFTGQGTIEVDVIHQVVQKVQLYDPMAQTFTLTEKRHIVGFDLKFCAKGDVAKPCELQVREVENGWPTSKVLARKRIDMAGVVLNAFTPVRFDFPLFLSNDREFCFVVLTDDPAHALSTASLGQIDVDTGTVVAAQPYSVGVMLTSSNASTWTAHQSEDVTFRIVAAKFAPTTKTVNLGSFAVTNMSDVQVRGTVELPTEEAVCYFEVERASGEIMKLAPGQARGLTDFANETVQLRAVLNGSDKISPVLYPGILMVAGTLRGSGVYVSRVFEMGTAVRVSTYLKKFVPSGATCTVEMDAGDDVWVAASSFATDTINDYWTETEYRKTPYTAVQGRLRITLTGTPAARPLLGDLRAVAI